jgi:hypothetical protein
MFQFGVAYDHLRRDIQTSIGTNSKHRKTKRRTQTVDLQNADKAKRRKVKTPTCLFWIIALEFYIYMGNEKIRTFVNIVVLQKWPNASK